MKYLVSDHYGAGKLHLYDGTADKEILPTYENDIYPSDDNINRIMSSNDGSSVLQVAHAIACLKTMCEHWRDIGEAARRLNLNITPFYPMVLRGYSTAVSSTLDESYFLQRESRNSPTLRI